MSVFQTPLITEFVVHCKWLQNAVNWADLNPVTSMFTTSTKMLPSYSSPKNYGSESGENVWLLHVFSTVLITDRGQFLSFVSIESGKNRSGRTRLPCSK